MFDCECESYLMVQEIVEEVKKLSVRFTEVEKKIIDVADCVGRIVEDLSNSWSKIRSSDRSEFAGQS